MSESVRSPQLENPEIEDRQNDPSEAVGFYTDGALLKGFELPPESAGHLKIFRPRNRAWGTKTLVRSILESTTAFREQFPTGDRVQVGDLASENGGFLTRHDSHQNGLDADVAYLRMNHEERDPEDVGELGFNESFVKNNRITKNFDVKRNWFLLKEVVLRGKASRVFIDPEIKRAFCVRSAKLDPDATDATRAEVLRRLRPYPNHADHFHMRVRCPKTSPKCLTQSDPPEGTGCDRIDEYSTTEHDEMGAGGP